MQCAIVMQCAIDQQPLWFPINKNIFYADLSSCGRVDQLYLKLLVICIVYILKS